jgi:hypothetical protein
MHLEDVIQTTREEASRARQAMEGKIASLEISNNRLEEAQRLVLQYQQEVREAQLAIDTDKARLKMLSDKVECFEFALEAVLNQ